MITTPNPFRAGTKLWRIFDYMADDKPHCLQDITHKAYGLRLLSGPLAKLYRRRTASALRTIRAHPGLGVDFLPDGFYVMTEQLHREGITCDPFLARPLQS